MSLVLNGSGTITGLSAGGLPDATITQAEIGTNVAGTGPAFSAYQSSSQSLSAGTNTKVNFQTEEFDTNANFASSRFTPTVAGYYQVNSTVAPLLGAFSNINIYKNGSEFKRGSQTGAGGQYLYSLSVSALVYLNGSTDYVEIYVYADAQTISASSSSTYFQAAMVRAA